MVCIYCGGETRVINSRPQKRLNHVWRRRQCLNCGTVFSTSEAPDYTLSWTVRSPHKPLEPFSRDKLFLSLYESCRHRSSALEDASALSDTVIRKLLSSVEAGAVERAAIVSLAQVTLNRFDKVASVHYQAFHQP